MAEKISVKTAETNSDEIDLGRLLGTLLDNRWLIVGVTAVFTIIGILYATFATPIYKADALVQVEQGSGNTLLKDISSSLPDSKPESAAEIEIIKSRMVVGKTVEDLSLSIVVQQKYFPIFGKGFARLMDEKPGRVAVSRLEVPKSWQDEAIELRILDSQTYEIEAGDTVKFEGKVGQIAKHDNISLLVSDIQAEAGTVFRLQKLNSLTAINNVLSKFIVADKGKDTGVLALSFEGEDPELTNKILNSISHNYLQQNVERKSEEAGKSLEFLKEQLPDVRLNLDDADDKLNAYRQENESVDLSLEAKAVLDTMVAIETQLNELTFKEAEVSKLYTKQHPTYRSLMEKRKTLEDEREKINKRVAAMPKTQQEILRLMRDVNVGQEVYMQLLNKQQELSINKASTVGNVRIIDPSAIQLSPVKPKKVLIVLLAMLLGGMISTAFVVLRAVLHKGIESPEQLEEMGINVYASVPLSEWQQKKDRVLLTRSNKSNTRSTELLAIGNPTDLAIEAIRSLRTSLHFAMMEAKNNVLMISGASPAIGKTFISANLGAVISQSGQRVLIVDCDMRKGYAHELMGTQSVDGLSDILSGQIAVEKSIRKTAVDNMDFIPRGQIPPNPSELLMHSRFPEFIKWAAEHYDIVLLDTPPILAVTDAAIISRHAGTSLLVARFEVNTLKEIEVSIRRFEQNGAEIKGVILNAIVKRAASYYGYGNYHYYTYDYKSEKNS
ncbi:tyrosine-protein kinase Wzc [Pectobacterium polaris]|uniref:Tyrosine-protein kinase Wzc n=2 Tax=Pectobacterium polaris TaxID=2042057 RepID=A0AAQ0X1L5_9GAMM|nr:tyrosine-protein kinase Wzc [Pectobacterium polaris]ASY78782.1 tyrosine-protein kinase [Pectobacterium polaris]MBW5892085.1 tyrosine-protein kinase Wzc [Pectobacterium polaris]MCA6940504.1 tyrosine-protein kinase Wzc [Pectobacterium polaris]MCU1796778.1 tyrosine-protein kinase Wzc [Pectobacterium polaris]RUS01583.1 tyrosine-protein kinase [Pectobacterium polaris]